MLLPKTAPVIDDDYRAWLREQPCRRCGASPCDPAHLGHSSIAKKTQGDDVCVSLCRPCHREMDTAFEGKEKWWYTQIVLPEERDAYQQWRASR